MKLTGNKGEWSEFYAFVKLLSTGKLYAADEKVNRMDDVFFPILKILRSEEKDLDMEYVISSEDGSVEVHWRADVVRKLQFTKKQTEKCILTSIFKLDLPKTITSKKKRPTFTVGRLLCLWNIF